MGALSADKRHMAAFCTVVSKHPQQCLVRLAPPSPPP
jgi:hypothetical protein